ncbi:MAG: hypothetical protein ABW116_00925 [Candidatus Sedimenticola sp. 20ELBAFRAG]
MERPAFLHSLIQLGRAVLAVFDLADAKATGTSGMVAISSFWK